MFFLLINDKYYFSHTLLYLTVNGYDLCCMVGNISYSIHIHPFAERRIR